MQLLSAGPPPHTGHAAAVQITAAGHPQGAAHVIAQTTGVTLQHAKIALPVNVSQPPTS